VVLAGVNCVPEHDYGRKGVPDARVVLNVVEPSAHVPILLLLLDGQVRLRERGEVHLITGRETAATIWTAAHPLVPQWRASCFDILRD